MTPPDKLSYEEAVSELDSILRTLQSDSCNIDKLSALTRRATELIAACRTKLTSTESEIKQILTDLSEQ